MMHQCSRVSNLQIVKELMSKFGSWKSGVFIVENDYALGVILFQAVPRVGGRGKVAHHPLF